MSKIDGLALARQNELRVLKSLHKFGWMRSRDIAALIWIRPKSASLKDDFTPQVVHVTASAWRMAQRTLRRLRCKKQVIGQQAPDGSTIYGLAESGARLLRDQDIPAHSGKDLLRRSSRQQYQHRRIANETAISSILQGYRAATEREIACGQWIGGMYGVMGKKPDVLVRLDKALWWVEVERSRRNRNDYAKLFEWLCSLWPKELRDYSPAQLTGNHVLHKVIFISSPAFMERLKVDLHKIGWSNEQIFHRISHVSSLYSEETKFLTVKVKAGVAVPV